MTVGNAATLNATVGPENAINKAFEVISFECISGYIKVSEAPEVVYGDVGGDGL